MTKRSQRSQRSRNLDKSEKVYAKKLAESFTLDTSERYSHPTKGAMAAEIQAAHVLKTGKRMKEKELVARAGLAPGSLGRHETYNIPNQMVVERMARVRELLLDELLMKDYSLVPAEKVSNILKNITHDMQLLSGGKTENVHIEEDRRLIQGILIDLRYGKKAHQARLQEAQEEEIQEVTYAETSDETRGTLPANEDTLS